IFRQFTGFHVGKHPAHAFPDQTQRPRNQHQISLLTRTRFDRSAIFMGTRLSRVVRSPINRVHHGWLCRRWSTWQGEIGIATQFLQQADLVVQTAMAPVWKGIVQGPIPVDKTKAESVSPFPEQPMPSVERAGESLNAIEEMLFALTI